MRRTLRFLVVVSAIAIYPALVNAQGHGSRTGHPSATAPHFATHSAAPAVSSRSFGVSHVPSGSQWVRTSSGSLVLRVPRRGLGPSGRPGLPGRTVLSQDVPGLGFDFPHLAAVHGDRRGLRDRDGFHHNRSVGVFFPFFGGGGYWPLFPEDVDEEAPADYQQQQAAEPEAPTDAPYPPYGYPAPYGARAPEQPTSSAAATEPEPERPTDQYVFVRRDGTVFFAVAYMWDNGTLRYVTSEGLRRSVAGSALDLNATQQFNEQRGLSFHSPA